MIDKRTKDKLKEKGYILLDETSYKNTHNKVYIIDDDGYKYYCPIDGILLNRNKPRRVHKSNPFSIQNIQLEVDNKNKKHNTIILSNEYKSQKQKLLFKCGKCGNIFEVTYNFLHNEMNEVYCKSCNHHNRIRYNKKKVFDLAKDKGYEILCYEGVHSITIKDKYGYIYDSTFYNLMDGCDFSSLKFNKKNIHTPYNINVFLKRKGSLLRIADETDRRIDIRNNKINFICPNCGRIFKANWGVMRRSKRQLCYECSKNISNIEYLTKEYLKELNIEYIQQKRFSDCKNIRPLPFDFYLPKYNICIEVNGQQHYYENNLFNQTLEERTRIDNIKREYCNKNNIRLLEIPFWDYYNNNAYKNKINTFIKNV